MCFADAENYIEPQVMASYKYMQTFLFLSRATDICFICGAGRDVSVNVAVVLVSMLTRAT